MDTLFAKNIWTSRLLVYLPFVLPFYLVRFKLGPLPTTLLEIYLGVLFMAFLIEYGFAGLRLGWTALDRFRLPVIAWLVTTLMAVFVSPNWMAGLGLWRAYVLEPILVFFILKSIRNKEKQFPDALDTLCRNLFLVTLALTIWGIVQFVTGWDIPHPWDVAIAAGRRATGPFPYPNALALFAVPVGALALTEVVSGIRYSVSDGNRPHTRYSILDTRYLPLLTLLSAFLSCLVARSDGGLIALGAAAWIALTLQKPFRRYVIAGTVTVTLLVALIPVIHQPIIRELTFQNWSGKVRLYMWRDTRAMLKDHWFFGAGFGGYPKVFKSYQRTTGIEVFQYPHNILLNFWSETGLLGLLAFLWVLVVWVRSIRTIHDQGFTIHLLPLFVILIHGLIDVPYFKNDLAILFWLLAWITTQKQQTSKLRLAL